MKAIKKNVYRVNSIFQAKVAFILIYLIIVQNKEQLDLFTLLKKYGSLSSLDMIKEQIE